MKIRDFISCTFEGDTASPPTTYVAEITSIDPAAKWLSCRWVDDDGQANFQYSVNTSGPWHGDDGAGADFVLETHDIYVPAAANPSAQDAAVVTFGDNRRYLCYVESVSQTTDVIFYHYPYYRLSLDFNSITASDWDFYPVGSEVISIERCVLDNEIATNGTIGSFNQGWWSLAARRDAHPHRIGEAIDPFSIVIHATDMVPESWNGLITRWTTEPGDGNCAHFAIGRDANAGVIQFAPVTRNAHHVSGGRFVAGTQSWRPNFCSVGIELHCTGAVQIVNGQWRYVERNVPYGPVVPDAEVVPNPDRDGWGWQNQTAVKQVDEKWRYVRDEPRGNPFPAGDVIPDPDRPGRGWHRMTDYQYGQLDVLLNALETVLYPLPAGCRATSVEPPPAWGVFPDGRIVGHVSLDAYRRSDPWPATCNWLRAR